MWHCFPKEVEFTWASMLASWQHFLTPHTIHKKLQRAVFTVRPKELTVSFRATWSERTGAIHQKRCDRVLQDILQSGYSLSPFLSAPPERSLSVQPLSLLWNTSVIQRLRLDFQFLSNQLSCNRSALYRILSWCPRYMQKVLHSFFFYLKFQKSERYYFY